jgi:hypothetical protein
MIDLGTLAGLLEHEHQLAAYCRRCSRWRVLPLAELGAAGHGSRRFPLTSVIQSNGSLLLKLVRLGVVTAGRSRYTRSPTTMIFLGDGHREYFAKDRCLGGREFAGGTDGRSRRLHVHVLQRSDESDVLAVIHGCGLRYCTGFVANAYRRRRV